MAAGRMSWTGATLTFPLLLALLAAGLPGRPRRPPRTRAGGRRRGAHDRRDFLSRRRRGHRGQRRDAASALRNPGHRSPALGELPPGPRRSSSPGSFSREPRRRKSRGCRSSCRRRRCSSWPGPRPRGPSGPRPARLLLPAAAMLSAWFAFGASRRIFFGYSGYGTLFDLHPGHFRFVLAAVGRSLSTTGHAPALARAPRVPSGGAPAHAPLAPSDRHGGAPDGVLPVHLHPPGGRSVALDLLVRARASSRRSQCSSLSPRAWAPEASGVPRAHDASSRVAWFAGAAALALFPLWRFFSRPLAEQLRLPLTPVDRVDGARARQWRFLAESRPHVPPKSSFTVLAADPEVEMALYMMSFGALPDGTPAADPLLRQPDSRIRTRSEVRPRVRSPRRSRAGGPTPADRPGARGARCTRERARDERDPLSARDALAADPRRRRGVPSVDPEREPLRPSRRRPRVRSRVADAGRNASHRGGRPMEPAGARRRPARGQPGRRPALEPESRRLRSRRRPRASRLGARSSCIAAVSLALLGWALVRGSATSVDYLFFWGVKSARFADVRGVDVELLRWPFFAHAVVDYPPLVPIVQAFGALAAADRFPWRTVPLTSLLWVAAAAPLLRALLRRRLDGDSAAAVTAFWVAAMSASVATSLSGANAEAPLLFFESDRPRRAADRETRMSSRFLPALMLAGAVLTKVEGSVAAILIVLGVVVRDILERQAEASCAGRRRARPASGRRSVSAWFLFQWHFGLRPGFRGHGGLLSRCTSTISARCSTRLPLALEAGTFGVSWILPLVLLIAARPRARPLLPALALWARVSSRSSSSTISTTARIRRSGSGGRRRACLSLRSRPSSSHRASRRSARSAGGARARRARRPASRRSPRRRRESRPADTAASARCAPAGTRTARNAWL